MNLLTPETLFKSMTRSLSGENSSERYSGILSRQRPDNYKRLRLNPWGMWIPVMYMFIYTLRKKKG